MSESIWTTTPPTVPGWYWACWTWGQHEGGGAEDIVRVAYDGGRLVALYSEDRITPLDFFYLWSDGPITLPRFRLFDTSAPPVV